jgi:hypothetical protein
MMLISADLTATDRQHNRLVFAQQHALGIVEPFYRQDLILI